MPPPVAAYEYRRRPSERIYDAQVTSVHAVVGPPNQRCWVEREHTNDPNVGGAVVGAILGGVLGHQVGSGRGNDVATAAGAVGGAVAGNQIEKNRNGGEAYRVVVEFRDGRQATFVQESLDGIRVGDRVRVDGNRLYRD